jgi:PAS domain S-box-containing protein
MLACIHAAVLRKHHPWVRVAAWLGCFLLIILGDWLADRAATAEAQRLRQMVEGFPPTYGAELERMGHASITPHTAPDDPIYLSLIQAQKRWLTVNHSINDVFTFRRLEDGSMVLVVDAETDYDHNGKYEGETEARTPIYTPYQEKDPELEQCFTEQRPTFSSRPYTDKWGTWVSAYCPLYDSSGKMEGVVGVDFAAAQWTAAIQRARLASFSYLAAVTFTLVALGLSAQLRLNKVQQSAEHREAELDRSAKVKFQALVNAIQAVVWEREEDSLHFVFVSDQVEPLFGMTAEQWTASPSAWLQALHPEDQHRVTSQLRHASCYGGAYEIEYRLNCNGAQHWVRENGLHVPATADSPAALRGVITDISIRKKALEDLEQTQRQLVDASRKAGMAEVASGVLHNVGNVLNSINVSSTLIHDTLRQSRLQSLGKLATLLTQQPPQQLGYYITQDPRGKTLPTYLQQLAQHLGTEQHTLRTEVEGLVKNVEHIKDIIVMQQDYARVAGRMEPLSLRQVVDDALEVSNTSFYRHRITVERRFSDVPKVLADRHKLLQILINLIRNAKHALEDSNTQDRILILEVSLPQPELVRLRVIDNGIGIPPENLKRIFNHGFTTKEQGHGFGLHSSAIAAREMGGSLTAHSDGAQRGATFVLEVPAQILTHEPAALTA